MRPTLFTSSAPLRTGLLVLGVLLSPALVQAQTPASTAPAAASAAVPERQADDLADGRKNQKIEHITTEDSGARVDERRYGGVTQSISVQPKSGAPAYDIQPTDERRARAGDNSGGSRVWNVLKF